MKRLTLSRRTLLRGVGGAAIGLPALEIMAPRRAGAAPIPRRYVVCYGGSSLGGYGPGTNGVNYLVLPRPTSPTPDSYALTLTDSRPILATTAKIDLGVVSGLRIPWGSSGQIPPGGRLLNFHGTTLVPQATGLRQPARDRDATGPSSDQIVAEAIGGGTRFRSLHLLVQPQSYRATATSRRRMAWGRGGQPIEPRSDLRSVFDSLFTGAGAVSPSADPAAAKAALELARLRRTSALDLVRDGTMRLAGDPRLGSEDRARLQRYLEELRALEASIQKIGDAPASASCAPPAAPAPLPAASGSYSQEDRRAELMTDYLALALACNHTRVATLQLTWTQCFMSIAPISGRSTDVHEASHAAGTPMDVAAGIKWHVKHFARLAARLAELKEVDGSSVLDHTALVLFFEGGHGFDPEASRRLSSHSSENMMVVYAGRAGGLRPGKHVLAQDRHPAQVMLTAMNAVGVATERLGEVSGAISEMMR